MCRSVTAGVRLEFDRRRTIRLARSNSNNITKQLQQWQ